MRSDDHAALVVAWDRFRHLASRQVEDPKRKSGQRLPLVIEHTAPEAPGPDVLGNTTKACSAWIGLWAAMVTNIGWRGPGTAEELATEAWDAFGDLPLEEASMKAELYLRSRVRVTRENRENGVVDDDAPGAAP